MRVNRFILSCLGVAAISACENDKISTTTPPALAAVRYINSVADTGSVDIAMIDQVEWSAYAKPLAFRAASAYQPAEAKARHIRVFPTSLNIGVTSQILLDTTVNLTAGSRVTLLLTGSARAKTLKFVVIDDDVTPPAAAQISMRLVNASTAPVNVYVTADTADVLPANATFANITSLAASSYVSRAVGKVAVQATDVPPDGATAKAVGPNAPPSPPGDVFPAAGVNTQYTKFSVYYFPRGVAGSPQNAVNKPGLVWFVDRNPCDPGVTC
jgi:hypothetical protein